ncbi:MAG: glutamine-hydrolyzing carbamoyl-phosphate synthase small subunit [Candidatus Bathyarchaeota archaeon]|nr:MAG: glutamine-hydrolyzing carbamoyl-phosphate synthase small subunit [Candidatus Bathyarchaeota archaeon]
MEEQLDPLKPGKAVLVLEDGSHFLGHGFGAVKKVSGEVVFSTSMVGYPEALTDPSYKGQILTLTYPLVGNYGVPPYDLELGVPRYFESESIKVTGFVIHELCKKPYHWATTRTLDQWLKHENIPGIHGIDTRKLTKKLRVKGVMLGILQVCEKGEEPNVAELLREVEKVPDPNMTDLVKEVSIIDPLRYKVGGNKVIVLIDCGAKYGILRTLLKRGINVIRVPYNFSAEEIQEYDPDGVIVSNGPGDPKKCVKTIQCVQRLVAKDVPIMGICLGTQILALALGGDTFKLKYGHRSQNQPALNLETNRCYITTQNHGYSVSLDSLNETALEAWFINANDKTVEGIRHKNKPSFALQWHPEASPGPYDTEFLFDEFLKIAGG